VPASAASLTPLEEIKGSKGTVPGLAARLGEVAEDPLRCVVRGAAAMLTAGGARHPGAVIDSLVFAVSLHGVCK
jgi:hypothetical protein